MESDELDDLLTTAEVARISRRSVGTIHNRVSRGLAPQPIARKPRTPLLFTRAEVRRWLFGEEPEEA